MACVMPYLNHVTSFFSTTPIVTVFSTIETDLFVAEFNLDPTERYAVLIDFVIAAQITPTNLFSHNTYRMYVDDIVTTQSGFESDGIAPELNTSSLIWGANVSKKQTITVRITAQTSVGTSNADNNIGKYQGSKGAALSTIILRKDAGLSCKSFCLKPFPESTRVHLDSNPLTNTYTTESKLFDVQTPVDPALNIIVATDFVISAERTLNGHDTYRMKIQDTAVGQVGYESGVASMQDAPRLHTSMITWGGHDLRAKKLSTTVEAASSAGQSNVDNTIGNFQGSKSASLRILSFPAPKKCQLAKCIPTVTGYCNAPPIFFSNVPMALSYGTVETTLFDEKFLLPGGKIGTIFATFTISSERTFNGLDTYRLYVDGTQIVQGGYDSEGPTFAPDLSASMLIWNEQRKGGPVSIRVTAQSSSQPSNIDNSIGNFQGAKGASLRILFF